MASRLAFVAAPAVLYSAAATDTCVYPGGNCYKLQLQLCSGASTFTLHGLWPEWANDCSGPAFDISALDPIRSQLEESWPSCYDETTEDFWNHEWTKHGTCSGMGQLEFFTKALQLQQQYNGQCSGGNTCAVCLSADFSVRETCPVASNGTETPTAEPLPPAPPAPPAPTAEPRQNATTACIYPGGDCYKFQMQLCTGANEYTIHGLWPEWADTCSGPAFDVSLLDPIRSQMEAVWPSCYGETIEDFWAHEWTKHGTCSGMGQLEYFQKALSLQQQYAGSCSGSGSTCAVCLSSDFVAQETCPTTDEPQPTAAPAAPVASSQVCTYPGGTCYKLQLNLCGGSNSYTLHGLWPEWAQNCHGPAYDAAALAPIRDQLQAAWPSCFGETHDEFWSHEWSKHGTCSGMNQLDYFSKALQLQQQFSNTCGGATECAVCFSQDFSVQESCPVSAASPALVLV